MMVSLFISRKATNQLCQLKRDISRLWATGTNRLALKLLAVALRTHPVREALKVQKPISETLSVFE
jgi:hypothetical protein